jgi:hypothetical protein
VSLTSIFLSKDELGALLGNPYAWDGLFNQSGSLAEPANRCFKPIGLDLKFENASVALFVGLKLELIELTEVKLTNLKIEPMVGGLTELKLTVQATPDMDSVAAPLLNWMGRDADVEIDFGDIAANDKADKAKQQPELALNNFGDDEVPDRLEDAIAADEIEQHKASAPKRRGRPSKARGADSLN